MKGSHRDPDLGSDSALPSVAMSMKSSVPQALGAPTLHSRHDWARSNGGKVCPSQPRVLTECQSATVHPEPRANGLIGAA